MPATASDRIKFAPVDGTEELFTPEFVEYLVFLHDKFTPRVRELLSKRAAVLDRLSSVVCCLPTRQCPKSTPATGKSLLCPKT